MFCQYITLYVCLGNDQLFINCFHSESKILVKKDKYHQRNSIFETSGAIQINNNVGSGLQYLMFQ